MKTVSIREMKANWTEIERQVARGETFEVLNRGKPAARIVPARPRKILSFEGNLGAARYVRTDQEQTMFFRLID